MTGIEFFLVVAAGVGSVLSVIASVFSALGAARSADVAVKAEQRAEEAQRAADDREKARIIAKARISAAAAVDLLNHAKRATRGFATLTGNLGGSGQKQIEGKIDERLAQLGAMQADPTKSLIELDELLMDIEAARDWASRLCDRTEQDRIATLSRDAVERSASMRRTSGHD